MVRDAGLAGRMAATLGLVVLVDLLVVATAVALLAPWLAPIQAAVVDGLPVSHPVATAAWWLLVLVPALALFVWAQLRYTRRETLGAVDAEVVDRETHPELLERVTRLAQQAGVRPPAVAVGASEAPNSFAVGTAGDATIVVTEGLLARLDPAELEAVLAHELAHLANRDVAVMTLASFLPAVTAGEYSLLDDLAPGRNHGRLLLGTAIALVAALLARVVLGAPSSATAFLGGYLLMVVLTAIVGAVALGVLTAPVVLLGRSLSRYREFAADAGAADLVGDPTAMASALERLDPDLAGPPSTDERVAASVRGLSVLPPDQDDAESSPFDLRVRSHPPTSERIRRLRSRP